MPEDIAINGFEAMCLDVGQTVERVDDVLYGIASFKVANNLAEGSRDGVDGKVALAEVFLDSISSKARDIEDNFMFFVLRALWQRNDNAASFIVHINIVSPQLIGQAPCRRRCIAGGDDIPVVASFSQQDVAQGPTDEVGLLALAVEVLCCLL